MRAGMLVSIIFAVSALLGFLREIVLAAYFGTSSEIDALLVAMLIPNFFLGLLGEASLGAAVVPVFLRYIAPQATPDQRRIVGSAFALISMVLVPLAAIAILLAPALAKIFAPGFSEDGLRLTALLMRIMLPSVLFLGLANFITGILHSFRRFGAAAASGVIWNLAIVVTTVPLAQRFGIVAPALGVLLGSMLQLAIMLPSLSKSGFLTAFGLSFREPALARIWTVFWPILAGALLVQLMQIADKVIASFLPAGSIAALNYASRIAGGPSRIFAMAAAVVLFPSFAKDVSDETGDIAQRVARGFNVTALLTLPWAALFIALGTPIVAVLLQRGAFDARATLVVALPLAVYSVGKFADGISTMLNNAFYSHHDSRTPVTIDIATKVLRIVLILALVGRFGYVALPLGHVIGVNVALLLLLAFLRKRIPELDLRGIGRTFLKLVVASAVCGIVAGLAFTPISRVIGTATTLQAAGSLSIAFLLALAAYLSAATALGVREVGEMAGRVRALIARSSPA